MNSLPLSESMPRKGNGNRPRASRRAWKTVCWPRLRSATHSVQPVATSVTVRLCRYSPRVVLPQCTTRSISVQPGSASSHSAKVRIGIALLRSVPGLVVPNPCGLARLRSACSRRSAVAGRRSEQALFGLRLQVQFPVLFEHPHQLRQIGDQALATHAIGGSPAGHQPLLHRKGILTRARPFLAGRGLGDRVIEQAEAHTCDGSRYWRGTPPRCACAPPLRPPRTLAPPLPTTLSGLSYSS